MDDQKLLSSDDGFGAVTMCPGGVVHVNLPHFTLKFLSDDFERFSDLIAKARINLDPPKKIDKRPRLQLVSPDAESEEETRE